MQMTGTFDASTVPPEQGGSKHPTGSFQFQINGTAIKAAKDEKSGMLVVEFSTPAGSIEKRYNLWHDNPQTVEIANKQLSALCHATGIFRLDFANEAAALRGGRGTLEVGDQIDKQTKQPNGYVEVKKVFDVNGNEPGKAPAQGQQQGQQGGWGASQPQQQPNQNTPPQQTQNPPQQSNGGGWGSPQPQPGQGQQTNSPPNQGWQQGQQGGNERPPWAGK